MSANSKYVRITKSMITSRAWKELDTFDKVAYMHFKLEYNGNKKEVKLPYKDMDGVMSRDRFKKCIDNLLKVGLIDIVHHRPQARDATIYGLSSRWHKFREPDFVKRQRPILSRTKQEP